MMLRLRNRPAGFGVIVLTLVAAVVLLVLGRQWLTTAELRASLVLARGQSDDLSRLQIENRRLKEKQVSAAELERLRADHAALPRLRAEVEALKAGGPLAP
jgi:hypothetical protein